MDAGDSAASTLPAAIAERLAAAFGTNRFNVRPLTDVQSLNNDIRQITVPSGEVFALRIASERAVTQFGVDRRDEALIARMAGAAGIGPEIVDFDTEDGLMLTRWIPDSRALTATEFRQPDNIVQMIGLLRRLADLPLSASAAAPARFFTRIKTLLASAATLSPEAAAPLIRQRDRLLSIAEAQEARTEQSRSFTHNDVCPNNVLTDGRRLWLVDWEFSSLGDGLYDLATIASSIDAGAATVAEMLSAYGRTSSGDAAIVRDFIWTGHFFEAAWGLVMAALAEPGLRANGEVFDFSKHAANVIALLDD